MDRATGPSEGTEASELELGAAPPGFRSGFASIVGRPNTGKSTLLNQILRRKVSIVSRRAQTTRNAIRGVLTSAEAQVVFVDTPGLHKPRTVLGERLNAVVRGTIEEVDVVVLLVDADDGVGRGDRFLASELATVRTPVLCAVNKVDLVDPRRLEEQTGAARELGEFRAVLPVSAKVGAGVPELVAAIVDVLPEGPVYYPPDMVTDQPEAKLVAELVREKALELMREEVPHSVAVVVDEMTPREEGELVDVEATIYVERSSQKGIVIGRGGRTLKEIGSRARREIEPLLGNHVYLRLRVKVEPDWQKRAALVERFGYGT